MNRRESLIHALLLYWEIFSHSLKIKIIRGSTKPFINIQAINLLHLAITQFKIKYSKMLFDVSSMNGFRNHNAVTCVVDLLWFLPISIYLFISFCDHFA